MESSLSWEAASVNRPMRIIKIGMRGTTSKAMRADQKSSRRMTPRAAGVTVHTRTSWGRKDTK